MNVRRGVASGLPATVETIEVRGREYEACEPVARRKAAASAATTRPFFASPHAQGKATLLVASDADRLPSFLIAMEVPKPLARDPGGPTILIDDLCVAESGLWLTVSRHRLDHARQVGREAGWRQVVVVCDRADWPESDLLRYPALSLALTWWTARA